MQLARLEPGSRPTLQDIELARKLNRMTLLAGLVGSDGMILAADNRWVEFARDNTEFNNLMGGPKIFEIEKHHVAYAVAGDRISILVGRELRERVGGKEWNWQAIDESLETLANHRYSEESKKLQLGNDDRDLIVVFYGPEVQPSPQMWHLQIQGSSINQWQGACNAVPISSIVIGGARGNSARHFVNYFRWDAPVEKLKVLAAHVILAGHTEDGLIDGLDMVEFGGNVRHWLTEQEKRALRERSFALTESISAHLFQE